MQPLPSNQRKANTKFPLEFSTKEKTNTAKCMKGEGAEGGLTYAALLVGVEIRDSSSLVT